MPKITTIKVCFLPILFSIACDLGPVEPNQPPPSEGLVLHIPFTGDLKNKSSLTNVDGIPHGGTFVTDRFGNAAQAYELDGENDFIEVPHNDAYNFDLNDNFTLTIWVKSSANQISQPNCGACHRDIVSKWKYDPTAGFFEPYYTMLRYKPENGHIYSAQYDNCGNQSQNIGHSQTINTDKFSHVVLIKKGGNLLLFLDGILIDEKVSGISCSTKSVAPLTIGQRHVDISNKETNFKGIIDDIRVYDRALTESEVLLLYNEK